MKNKLPAWCLLVFYFCPAAGPAQTWTQTSAPAETWRSITCSTNGTRLIAAGDDGIYESLDGGLTWLFLNPTPSDSVACSADGTKIVAAGSGAVYTSPDSGATWQQHALSSGNQYYVASSGDGTNLAAVGYDGIAGSIIFSPNSGGFWSVPIEPAAFWTGSSWSAVACSADGTKMVAAAEATDVNGSFQPGPIYISSDSGETWGLSGASSNVWYSVASSADGTRLVAAAYAGPSQIGGTGLIYRSASSGTRWTNISPSTNYWMSVASSADGTNLIAVSLFDQNPGNPGVIWRSTNSGTNWSEDALTGYFNSAAISADGTKMAVTDVVRDRIYTLGEPAATAPLVFPILSVSTAGNQWSLSWGVSNAAGFVLLSTTNLAPSAIWSQVTNIPTLGKNQIQVILPNSQQNQFFRLNQL